MRLFLAGVALVLGMVVVAVVIDRPPRVPQTSNTLGYPPNMVDRLVHIEWEEAWKQGEMAGVEVTAGGVALHSDGKRHPARGVWTSPQMSSDFPFTELLPSWNVTAPAHAGVRVEVRVRDAGSGAWSPWLYVGSWGRRPMGEEKQVMFEGGTVQTDYLDLDRPADAFQIRADLVSFHTDPKVMPALRRVSVAYSGVVADDVLRQRVSPVIAAVEKEWARDLPVPFRTQVDAPPPYKGEICSPTSTTMVMAYYGIDLPLLECAAAIYDEEAEIFGNWNRAVQFAASYGLEGHLQRFRSWEEVKPFIAEGVPVIASIKFKKGEFPSSVLVNGSSGHLLVIRGFEKDGRVIVNDPASKLKGERALYDAGEFARAWFDKGGVGYVIRKPREAISAR